MATAGNFEVRINVVAPDFIVGGPPRARRPLWPWERRRQRAWFDEFVEAISRLERGLPALSGTPCSPVS